MLKYLLKNWHDDWNLLQTSIGRGDVATSIDKTRPAWAKCGAG